MNTFLIVGIAALSITNLIQIYLICKQVRLLGNANYELFRVGGWLYQSLTYLKILDDGKIITADVVGLKKLIEQVDSFYDERWKK